MDRTLEGQSAIVSGAGSGIGRAIALRLAAEGARVGLFDISPRGADETAELIAAAGGAAQVEVCDITDHATVSAAVERFEAAGAHGTDILVNNAGWDQPTPFLQSEPALWHKVVAINWFGPLNMTHVVARGMAQRRRGRIIHIASDAGRTGAAGVAVYAGCKGATIAFGKSLARELARQNVLVNTICPGPTDTPGVAAAIGSGDAGRKLMDGLARSVPLGRIGRPDDCAGLVVFLASKDAGFITGQVISVSGGLTMHG